VIRVWARVEKSGEKLQKEEEVGIAYPSILAASAQALYAWISPCAWEPLRCGGPPLAYTGKTRKREGVNERIKGRYRVHSNRREGGGCTLGCVVNRPTGSHSANSVAYGAMHSKVQEARTQRTRDRKDREK
jgi:hypothetical protein